MLDRVPTKPGRVLITPEGGGSPYYAVVTRADEPVQEGTPLNKGSLLTDAVAGLFGLSATATPNDVLNAVKTQLNGKAPTNHRSTGSSYGAATGSYYGHVKLSDSTTSTSGAASGVAATPAAVKAAMDAAKAAVPEWRIEFGTLQVRGWDSGFNITFAKAFTTVPTVLVSANVDNTSPGSSDINNLLGASLRSVTKNGARGLCFRISDNGGLDYNDVRTINWIAIGT